MWLSIAVALVTCMLYGGGALSAQSAKIIMPEKDAFEFNMLITDMDGTLLRSNSSLSEANAEKLRALHDAGLIVAIATGRPSRSVQPFADQLGIPNLPVILFNGAFVGRMQPGKTVPSGVYNTLPLPREDTEAVLAIGEALGLCVSYVLPSVSYSAPRNEAHHDLIRKFEELEGMSQTIIGGFEGLDSPLKIVFLADDPDATAAEARKRLPTHLATHVISAEMHVEFLNADANKGTALPVLAEMVGFPLSSALAFGDGNNDAEMLSAVGFGIAMRNAKDKTKSAADLVAQWSNDEDGVAQFLRHYMHCAHDARACIREGL